MLLCIERFPFIHVRRVYGILEALRECRKMWIEDYYYENVYAIRIFLMKFHMRIHERSSSTQWISMRSDFDSLNTDQQWLVVSLYICAFLPNGDQKFIFFFLLIIGHTQNFYTLSHITHIYWKYNIYILCMDSFILLYTCEIYRWRYLCPPTNPISWNIENRKLSIELSSKRNDEKLTENFLLSLLFPPHLRILSLFSHSWINETFHSV